MYCSLLRAWQQPLCAAGRVQDALVLGADRLKTPSQLPLHSGSSARQSVCLPRRGSTQKVTLKQGRIWEKAFLCVHPRAAVVLVLCRAGVPRGHTADPNVILKTVQQKLNLLFLLFSLIATSLLSLLSVNLSIHLSLLCMELNTVLKCGNTFRLLALQFLGSCLL